MADEVQITMDREMCEVVSERLTFGVGLTVERFERNDNVAEMKQDAISLPFAPVRSPP